MNHDNEEEKNMNSRNSKLYLECSSGISGDMVVAALLDLGADETLLRRTLDSLKVSGYEIVISRVRKSGLDACDFDVRLDPAHENHDHDMEYLHGDGSDPVHEHTHKHIHSHEHRGLREILEILRSGDLTPGALTVAESIFRVIARAEAKAHGVAEDQVHFHEVGAVDSIVDIAAAAICLDNLGIEEVIVPELREGRGMIRCQHGVIPVPVPAVCHIAEDYGLVLHMCDVEGELVTPTGAAIAAAVRTSDRLPERFIIEKTGVGAGKRNYQGAPGILRAMMIREETPETEEICKLESNIDDCSGEVLGYVMKRLLEAGARDVSYIPLFMKKNRPAWQLNVICDREKNEALEQIIFDETTTIGIRRIKVERSVLSREIRRVSTPIGEALVKVCSTGSQERAYPEYETAAALAEYNHMPLQEVYRIIRQSWEKGIGDETHGSQ